MSDIKHTSYKRLLFAFMINIVLIILALTVFVPFFEEIDDTHIAMIAEGAYGIREWHLIYPNFLLGKLYILLETFSSAVRWHTVIQYLFVFIAYVMTTYVISKHRNGYILSSVLCVSTFYEMYVSLQYTKTAAFLTTAGLILIFEYVRNRKVENASRLENILYIIFSCLFMIYGSLLRPEAFLIACIPMFFAGCLELYRTKNILRYVGTLIPIFAIVLICIVANNQVYKADSEWSDFMRYNKARMQLTDYRYDILHYPSNGEKLKELNVSENDAWIIVTYQFGDDNIFDTDCMENIRNEFGNKPFTFQIMKNLWESVGNEIKRCTVIVPVMLCLIILLAATIVQTERNRDENAHIDSMIMLAAMFGIGVLCAAALIYFQYSGRWSHRLTASLVIPTLYAISYIIEFPSYIKYDDGPFFEGGKKSISKYVLVAALAVAFVFNVVCCYGNRTDYANSQTLIEDKEASMKCFEDNQDTLFIIDTFTYQNAYKYDLFKPVKPNSMRNVVSCGSWFLNSPITKTVCGNFGYMNPYEALMDENGSAVLLDSYFPNEKALFLTEHYNKLYNAVQVGSINNIPEYVMEITE